MLSGPPVAGWITALSEPPAIVNWIAAIITIVGALITVVSALISVLRRPLNETYWERRDRHRKALMVCAVGVVVCVLGAATWVVASLQGPDEDDCGVARADDAIEVMVVWEHPQAADEFDELEAFCDVVATYTTSPVAVRSVGPSIGAALEPRFDGGDPPEVAIIPQPSLVRRYARQDRLSPVESDIEGRIPVAWNEFVTARPENGPERVWGAFVKGAHKSVFWYLTQVSGNAGSQPLDQLSLEQLRAWIVDNANDGDAPANRGFDAPLVLAGDPGWSLTDWFENELATTAPELYGQLAAGDDPPDWNDAATVRNPLRAVLDDMASTWVPPGVFPDDPGLLRSRLPDLDERLDAHDAALAFAPSFLAGHVQELTRNHRVFLFGFPRSTEAPPLVVGGDIAVVPAAADQPSDGHDFVRWLTSDAMDVWARHDPGFIAPNVESPQATPRPDDEENVREWLTSYLLQPPGGVFFDLSDDQFATRNQDDVDGSWDVFADFFRSVTAHPSEREAAVECVIDRLRVEYEGGNLPDCD